MTKRTCDTGDTSAPPAANPGGRVLRPCGTWAAYKRHLKAGEEPCDPCRTAGRAHRRKLGQCSKCRKPVKRNLDTVICRECRALECLIPPARGLRSHPLYKTWAAMITRCEKTTHDNYPRYGGRGIKVCERWHDLALFIADIERIGARGPGMTLDRIDNDGNYESGNVRWATAVVQRANQRIPLQPCGTSAGYQRHWEAGEQSCEPCLTARREYSRARRAARLSG